MNDGYLVYRGKMSRNHEEIKDMERHKIQTTSENQTIDFADRMSIFLAPQDVLFLSGPLGSGKSVFSRALIRKLSQSPDLTVPSPTFTLIQTYDAKICPLWHFDLYRIKTPEEIYEIGWEDALYDGISLVEWAEKMEDLAPPNRLEINFEPSKQNEQIRTLTLTPYGSWIERLKSIELET